MSTRGKSSTQETAGGTPFYGGHASTGARIDPYPIPAFRPRHSYAPLQIRTFLRSMAGAQLFAVKPLSGLTTRLGLKVATSEGTVRPGAVVTARYRGWRSYEPWDEAYVIEPEGSQ